MQLHTLITPAHPETAQPAFLIVFLHYFGGSLAEWHGVSRSLDHQLSQSMSLAMDLRGHGKSPDGNDHSVASMAQDVLETLEQTAGVRGLPYVLVGHSMGGKVAMQVATTQPSNLRGLILVAPSPPTPEPMTDDERQEEIESWHDDKVSRRTLDRIASLPISDEDSQRFISDRSRTTQAVWDSWYRSGSRENIGHLMEKIQVPTTILVGEQDPVVPVEVQRRETLGHLRNAFLSVVPGAGHLLPYEAPDATAALIASTLPRFT